ncbi:O-antigen polymerase [Paenibacillus puerhi]|uniref:O-antigen polymerase n=1 Tax=Paenibacillus puerhi TaxID=2692622 RepID=UPI00135CA670|nr:O-antigen polymerase [Paenibacillus puerhi]
MIFLMILIQLFIITFFYSIHKTLAHPTMFLQTYFTIHIVAALMIFGDYDFSLYGVFWMLIAMFSFSLGGLLPYTKKYIKATQVVKESSYTVNPNVAQITLFLSIFLGSCYSFDYFFQHGISLNQLLNTASLLELNNTAAIERYSGSSEGSSQISRLFLVSVYFSPLVGGYNFNFFKEKKLRILCLSSIFPALLVILTQNTKAILIGSLFLFISGYVTSYVKLNHKFAKFKLKPVLYLCTVLLLFLGINYLSMMMRVGVFDIKLVRTINEKFVLYALGHIPAFDIWFTNSMDSINYYFGTRTFYGIADFIGISERMQGIYDDRVSWGNWSTNVFTAFRPFIEDFGPYLGVFLMFFMGVVMSFTFKKIVSISKVRAASLLVLSSFYFYVLYGFITSVWAYMSYTLAFILFFIYIYVSISYQKQNENEIVVKED